MWVAPGCCSTTASTCCVIPLHNGACPAPRCCLLIYGQKQESGKCDSRLRSCLVPQCLCLSQDVLVGARAVAPLALHSAGTLGPKQWLYKGRAALCALPLLRHCLLSQGGSDKGFPKAPGITPPSSQWPNYEVGVVPDRLWAWSPLTRKQWDGWGHETQGGGLSWALVLPRRWQ